MSDEPIKAAFLKWCDEHAAFMRANGENIAASAARSMMDFEAGYRAAIRARVAELELSARIDAVTIEELRAERETMSAAIDRLACIADGFRAERDALSAQLRAAREQEPVAHIDDLGHIRFTDGGTLKRGDKLYAAPVPQPQEARDAERYRWLRDNSQTGAVKTLLPLVRSHYVVVNESAYDYPTFDEAIDAAILAAKEKK